MQRVVLAAALWAVAATLIVIVVAADVEPAGVLEPAMIIVAVFAVIGGLQMGRQRAGGSYRGIGEPERGEASVATAHGTGMNVWRRGGAAAVALAGAALTALCVVAWVVESGVGGIENFNDPHWFLLIFLTFGSVALLGLGIRDLLQPDPLIGTDA